MSGFALNTYPESERPRERLMRHGSESLSTAELLAVILGSGTKGKNVLELAHEILVRFENLENLAQATFSEMLEIRGLGPAKAIQLQAVLGLSTRMNKEYDNVKISMSNPQQVYRLVKDQLEAEKREVLLALLLDRKSCLIRKEIISIGTLSGSLVHPREVFYPAIRHKASFMILAHNHPSGDTSPSQQDIEVTEILLEASRLIDIPIRDHVIVGKGNYFSFRQERIMNFN